MNLTVVVGLDLTPSEFDSLRDDLQIMFHDLIVTDKWARLPEPDRDRLVCSYTQIRAILEILHLADAIG